MEILRTKAAPEIKRGAAEVCTLMEKGLASRRRRSWTQLRLFFSVAACGASLSAANPGAIDLSRAEALRIGRKIWQNECGGTIAGLTSWNVGENFASLGIGHFIWYPRGVRGPFEESFPELASFASSRNVRLPSVVAENRETSCPWKSRSEFLAASDSPEMRELRRFLAETVDLQTEFLVRRLQQALPKMEEKASGTGRAEVQRQFDRVASTPQGCYALVDYVNFKGEGVLESERYRGRGWGLLQVLQGMSGTARGHDAVEEFSRSARAVLTQRVRNSPTERKESRWLAGWLQRVNSYPN